MTPKMEITICPSIATLVSDYIRDLEIEIETNAEEIAAGRVDLAAYDTKCRTELAELTAARVDGVTLGINAYGIPSVAAGREAEIEALRLISACLP